MRKKCRVVNFRVSESEYEMIKLIKGKTNTSISDLLRGYLEYKYLVAVSEGNNVIEYRQRKNGVQ